jgi:hypothetical protein
MRRSWATALGGALVGCALTAVAVLAMDERSSPPDAAALAPAAAAQQSHDGGHGHGPPPWANAGGSGAQRGKPADDWKERWRALTPVQKTRKMRRLARAHEDGMREWARCVRDAGNAVDRRRDCEKPLPPGLAKKQP